MSVSAAGWPATGGRWAVVGAGSKAGNKVGTLLGNSPLIGWQALIAGPRGNCRRSDALRGVGRGTGASWGR